MISTKWFNGFENIDDAKLIRTKVFCEEQGISVEEEFDGSDDTALIVVLYEDDTPSATGRIIKVGEEVLLGRIAVLKEHRGKKYGDLIVRMLIRKAFDTGFLKQYIHAQTHAVGFYKTLGFEAFGEEYQEANIPHISMVREGDIDIVCGK